MRKQAARDTRFRPAADSNQEESYVVVDSARMYFLVDNHEFGPHELELRCSPGVAAFAFTFTSCVDPVTSALQAASLPCHEARRGGTDRKRRQTAGVPAHAPPDHAPEVGVSRRKN